MDFTTAAVCDGKHDWSVGQKPYPKPLLDKKNTHTTILPIS